MYIASDENREAAVPISFFLVPNRGRKIRFWNTRIGDFMVQASFHGFEAKENVHRIRFRFHRRRVLREDRRGYREAS